jgi:hypothetical protein
MLGAFLALFVFVAIMLTFLVGQRVREKIKLQALADSSAYSLAVTEARAYNFYAHANRAHVAHDVAVLSVHANVSYISYYEGMMEATSNSLYEAAIELALGQAACFYTGLCCQGIADANAVRKSAKYYRSDDFPAKGWLHDKWHENHTYDRALALAAFAHYNTIKALQATQGMVEQQVLGFIANQSLASSISGIVDQRIQAPGAVPAALNLLTYESSHSFLPDKFDDWAEFVSATRYPSWVTDRGFAYGGTWLEAFGIAEKEMISNCGFIALPWDSGNAKTLKSDPGSKWDNLHDKIHTGGDNVDGWSGYAGYGAEDHGGVSVVVFCWDRCGAVGAWWGVDGGVYSDPQHGRHWYYEKSNGESETAQRTQHGLGTGSSIYQRHVRYKWGPARGADDLWNQPRTFAMLTRPVSARREAWDFGFSLELPVPLSFKTFQTQGDAAANNTMAAISSGLVYYHKPKPRGNSGNSSSDNWREPPSLWNPFWRAKLHPLRAQDATELLVGHLPSMKASTTLLGKGINY